ncbi:MAG: AAA family ATPase [Eubacterium sp.]|nr:AAA family ATPase [Eubacterium sp.]
MSEPRRQNVLSASFHRKGLPVNSINLITGVRGCGKTVFVTQIADRLREKEWIIINLKNNRRILVTSVVS